MNEVKRIYNEFWKDIVENEDGSLNKLQVMKELYDYYNVMHNCSCAYDAMTRGRVSKPNTCYDVVYSIFSDEFAYKKYALEDLLETYISKDMTYDEIVEAIKEYFK